MASDFVETHIWREEYRAYGTGASAEQRNRNFWWAILGPTRSCKLSSLYQKIQNPSAYFLFPNKL